MSTSASLAEKRITTEADGDWWQLPVLAIVSGILLLIAATWLLLRGVEPFATWYYNFAWYPVLLAADGVVALKGGAGRKGEFLLLGNKRFLATVLAWSAVVWLFYELFNFRLQNWYYVFLPVDRASRWSGTVLAFATVLPAVFVSEAIFNGFNIAKRVRWPRFKVTNKVITGMRVAGTIMLALVLIWPHYFFALVWGGTMLLVEPVNYRRSREHSLLADLEEGKPGRLLRLLLGGACIGFTWEMLNINARGKWIYTVPGVEELKIFEMPVPGFLGFPPFAVECFILWQALVRAGVAVPRFGKAYAASFGKRLGATALAVAFSVGVLFGMERYTIDSYSPQLQGLPNLPANKLQQAGYTIFTLANAAPGEVAAATNADADEAARWIEKARLASLRGIGAENVRLLNQLGIHSINDLAQQKPQQLIASLKTIDDNVVDARVRVWIRGAQRTVGNL